MTSASPLTGAALARALLAPASIALIGASDDPGKTTGRPLRYLRQAGYAGRLYPINPNRAQVQGERAWPSLSALPEVPEHAFILTPTESAVATVEACGRLGVKTATLLASGFSESGPEGVAREAALRRICQETGLRLLGPSSLGIVRPALGLRLTANAAFAEPDLPTGRLFVASHSGSMIGALVSRGKARGIGFAGLVSVGNEVDLTLGEVCAATLDDPEIDGYLLFLESLRHGAALRDFAVAAAARGKPVVAYKLGRSAAAAEMAATHTGALAGADDIADAFLKGLGIARVDLLDALLETYPLARRLPLPASTPAPAARIGVVTTTGGGAAMVVDQLGVRGIDAQPPSAATLAQLATATGQTLQAGRVVDLTLAGTRPDVMQAALHVMLEAPEFDLIVVVVGSSARLQPELAVQPLLACADHTRPLAAFLVPEAPAALAALTAANIPAFRTPESCADAISALLARQRPASTTPATPPASGPTRTLDEASAYRLLDTLGVPHAPYVTLPLHGPAPDALPLPGPVVAKVCSAAIPHKTEVGGVQLNLATPQALADAMATLRRNLATHAPDAHCDTVLIQPMCRGLGEVLLGYRVDPDAGPLLLLAAGGIWAEVARDRSIRLAPVSLAEAHAMIGEVRALQPLTGLRGQTRGDLDALAQAMVALSQLALRPELGVQEAEVNPLLILADGEGVQAVDALVLQVAAAFDPEGSIPDGHVA